jgi:hypothetical protein
MEMCRDCMVKLYTALNGDEWLVAHSSNFIRDKKLDYYRYVVQWFFISSLTGIPVISYLLVYHTLPSKKHAPPVQKQKLKKYTIIVMNLVILCISFTIHIYGKFIMHTS